MSTEIEKICLISRIVNEKMILSNEHHSDTSEDGIKRRFLKLPERRKRSYIYKKKITNNIRNKLLNSILRIKKTNF